MDYYKRVENSSVHIVSSHKKKVREPQVAEAQKKKKVQKTVY